MALALLFSLLLRREREGILGTVARRQDTPGGSSRNYPEQSLHVGHVFDFYRPMLRLWFLEARELFGQYCRRVLPRTSDGGHELKQKGTPVDDKGKALHLIRVVEADGADLSLPRGSAANLCMPPCR